LPCMLQSEGLVWRCPIQSGIYRVTNPGKTGGNQLPPLHCETIPLSCAKPDGMSFTFAADPG
jgi:hypothetical protein